MGLKMLDDGRAFDHRLPVVEEEREQPERRMLLQYGGILLVVGFEQPVLERGIVRPEGDQDLLRIAAERVSKEFQHYQLPSAIAAWRASSRSLGGVVT